MDIVREKISVLEKTFGNDIPKQIKEHIEFFEQLDEEYVTNAKNERGLYNTTMFSKDHIKNKNWRGLWLHATGIDKLIYISWLVAGLTHLAKEDLKTIYLQAHPKEKYVPQSIILASEDCKIFYKQ